MAGSYRHVTTDQGNLRNPESFSNMIENLGDAYEAVEEMYGMIWYLAEMGDNSPDLPGVVEEARQHYEEGLNIAREKNKKGN